MRKYLVYFQRLDKVSLTCGILLGIVLSACLGYSDMQVQADEGTELHLADDVEVIDLEDLVMEQPVEDVSVIEVGTDLISEETLTKSSVTQPSSVGVELVEKSVKEETKIAQTSSDVPNEVSGCRSWNITFMDYTATTDKSSRQYALLNCEDAYTDTETGIRMVDGRYCIALGSYYTHNVGQYVDLIFTDGTVVNCILGECKADSHTDPTNRFHAVDGSVAEFVVDSEYFYSTEQWSNLCKGSIDKVIVLNQSKSGV